MKKMGLGASLQAAIAEVNDHMAAEFKCVNELSGGSQNGAFLLTDGSRHLVLKWQPDPVKAAGLTKAKTVIDFAVESGWPAARWVYVGGSQAGRGSQAGGGFHVQEFVTGSSLVDINKSTVGSVIDANRLQSNAAHASAASDKDYLDSVIDGTLPWKSNVSNHTSAGRVLVTKGDQLLRNIGRVTIPVTDVVHGDYSSSNMLLTERGTICFVDCETVRRGCRARDLADLLRQTYIYGSSPEAQKMLIEEGCSVAGIEVFSVCAIAVAYDNLAWWVEHKSVEEFDRSCTQLQELFAAIDAWT